MTSKFLSILVLAIVSCGNDKEMDIDFTDQVIDLAIESSRGKTIQFPELYDTLTSVIAKDDFEKAILVNKLKKRGFEVVKWGMGNHPPLSPRIINYELRRNDCKCEVTKIYQITIEDSRYQMVESLRCWNLKMKI